MKHCEKCNIEYADNLMFCSTCGTELKVKVFEVKESNANTRNKKEDAKYFTIGCIIPIIMAIVGFILLVSSCNSDTTKPKELKDYTNKEMNQFLEWRDKEQQKKHDNELFFK